MNLYEASNQWSTRPDDQRFWTIEEMRQQAEFYRDSARQIEIPINELTVAHNASGELFLEGGDANLRFSNYAFNQFCSGLKVLGKRGSVPRNYSWSAGLLSAIDPELTAMNLNYALKKQSDHPMNLLVHVNETEAGIDAVLRSVTSTKYARIWNADVCAWLSDLPDGWRVPPCRPARPGESETRLATQADVLRDQNFWGSVHVGQPIGKGGLYLGDSDMFVFLVNEGTGLDIPGGKEHLKRGFFAKNSEVGDSKLRFTLFYYSHVCSNMICWGVSNVREISFTHVGEVRERGYKALDTIQQEAIDSATNDVKLIEAAQSWNIGKTKEEVVEFVYEKRGLLSKANAVKSYDLAEQYSDIHGSPLSAWGIVSGITRLSQYIPYANERNEMDLAAGKILDLVAV